MKTYIALVRHGVTDWNYETRAQGQSDIPLNPEGKRQAEAVASRLATERWDAVYSSDLVRARNTAMVLCQLTGHRLITDERLRERNIGLAEGTTSLERQARWPGVAFESLPGVENDDQLSQRGEAIISEIARSHPGQRVLIFSHGGLIATFLRRVTGGTVPIGVSRNTGISPVLYDGQRFALAGPHDYRHLLIDGVEYTGEKFRLISEARRSGLPGVQVDPAHIDSVILHSSAAESAWVDDRLIAYTLAFTDQIHRGYIDLLYTLPEYRQVADTLVRRLEQRYPGVRFDLMTDRLEERSGA